MMTILRATCLALFSIAALLVMRHDSAAAQEHASGAPRLKIGRVCVKPVFLVPTDARAPPKQYTDVLMHHLRWAQARYRELLGGQDTFSLVEGEPLVLSGKHDTAYYKAAKDDGAEDALLELFAHDRVDRFTCPYIYVVLFVGTGTHPAGGARPINGFVNTGGGILVIGADNLVQSPNVQSTLQHELGHTFGLVHVDSYRYDMKTSVSLMSYNPDHHTNGFEASRTPGRLIPEDYRLLVLNHRVFPKLAVDPRNTTADYKMFPTIILIPAMHLTGQLDYTGPWNGIYEDN